jgi:hypothetical protein
VTATAQSLKEYDDADDEDRRQPWRQIAIDLVKFLLFGGNLRTQKSRRQTMIF